MTRPTLGRSAATLATALLLAATAAGLITTPAQAGPKVDVTLAEVVVKIDIHGGHTIDEVTADNSIEVVSAVLASRGIYLVRATAPGLRKNPAKAGELASRIARSDAVDYAEPNYLAGIDDTHYHAWPAGDPGDAGTDPLVWTGQPAVDDLRLAEAHAHGTGAGTVVAVLDTGIDADHPVLADRLRSGWDYVDDDGDPSDSANGIDEDGDGHADDAYGHGTFVSGVVALVAPDAEIRPARVLDDDGTGNIFAISEAILDATDAGADVINLSFGTRTKLPSKLLTDAIKHAKQQGVVIVAAAGNDGTDSRHYPAAQSEVLSVSALGTDSNQLAEFSDWGNWVDVAAPGQRVAGPVPGGRYAWWDGTSVAAPFVAGQASLIRSSAPDLDTTKLTDSILHTARELDSGYQPAYGAIDLTASLDFATNSKNATGGSSGQESTQNRAKGQTAV